MVRVGAPKETVTSIWRNPTKTLNFVSLQKPLVQAAAMAKTYAAGLLSAIAATASGLSQNAFSDTSIPSSSSNAASETQPPSQKVRNDHPRTTSAGFDPEALERGSKALKEIAASGNAKKVKSPFISF